MVWQGSGREEKAGMKLARLTGSSEGVDVVAVVRESRRAREVRGRMVRLVRILEGVGTAGEVRIIYRKVEDAPDGWMDRWS
jgi:hypothetical protein